MFLVGLFVHAVYLPIAQRQGKPGAQWFHQRLGVFMVPLNLGILVFCSALIFHYLKPVEASTQAREYKEFAVAFLYLCILIDCYYKKRPAVQLVYFCLIVAGATTGYIALKDTMAELN